MMRIGFLLFIVSFFHMFTSYVTSQQAQVIPQEREMMFGDTSRTGVPFSKDPHVVNFDGRYLMYYSIPPMKGVESSGWNIGIAESKDLITWEKIGEIVPDPQAEYEKNGLCAPGALVKDGKVHLFYQTYGNERNDAICHAFSSDGIHFERNETNPIFKAEGDWNCGRAIDAEVYEFKDQYFLYFATRDPDFKIQMLGVAVAPKGTNFNREEWQQPLNAPILYPQLAWEGECIEGASITVQNDRMYMFYAGAYNNWPQQVGVAVSDDGLTWKRLFDEPFLPNGKPGEWNESESGHPHIFTDHDGRTYLFFQGNNDKGKSWYISNKEVFWKDGLPSLINKEEATHNTVPVRLGDPFIMLYDDVYYAYGTNANDGIEVYTSDDLKEWEKAPELALHKDNSYGDKWFWAPEVYYVNGKFYMYYSAEEHICVAVADSPLGPFKQSVQKPMLEGEKSIDNSLFLDDDGTPYLFFDRFNDGLNIWVAQLDDDLMTIKKETLHPCIHVSQEWEEVWPRVNEGAFVVKHNGIYYLTYSANSYESQFYGIGCATATNIMGEWTKYPHNPLLQRPGNLVGVGHSSMFKDKEGNWKIVFHAHKSDSAIHPRKMFITSVVFRSVNGVDELYIDPDYETPLLREK